MLCWLDFIFVLMKIHPNSHGDFYLWSMDYFYTLLHTLSNFRMLAVFQLSCGRLLALLRAGHSLDFSPCDVLWLTGLRRWLILVCVHICLNEASHCGRTGCFLDVSWQVPGVWKCFQLSVFSSM